jgi:hypothetical protein
VKRLNTQPRHYNRGDAMTGRAIKAHVGAPRAEARFVKLPVALLNDGRLDATEVATYAVMRDASREDICRISLPQIGKRTRRKERAAQRSVRRLQAAGWIETIESAIGRCAVYRLLTPATEYGGSSTKTPATNGRGVYPKLHATPDPDPTPEERAADIKHIREIGERLGIRRTPVVNGGGTPVVGDTQPPPSVTKTPAIDDVLPRRSLDCSLERAHARASFDKENDDENDAVEALIPTPSKAIA